jgi:hypothetical protein
MRVVVRKAGDQSSGVVSLIEISREVPRRKIADTLHVFRSRRFQVPPRNCFAWPVFDLAYRPRESRPRLVVRFSIQKSFGKH